MLFSGDGGATWLARRPANHQDQHMLGLHFEDALTGWVVGTLGLVLFTEDAGLTWRLQRSGTATLHDVVIVDGGRGWAVGAQGVILTTRNRGSSWVAQRSCTAAATLYQVMGTRGEYFSVVFLVRRSVCR